MAKSVKVKPLRFLTHALLFSAIVTVMCGCESTVRKTMYSAYEKVGIEKRDILRRRVDSARDDQKEASESFQDALETFQKMYKFDGGNLEHQYNKVKSSYERSADDAAKVHKGIVSMEKVAGDLFDEWENEAKQMESKDLREKSLELRSGTQKRYETVHATLKKSEARMDPILKKLNDQVLFLKHNLNAKAISSLSGESATMEKEIQRLMTEIKAAISEADGFIKELR